MANEKLDGLLVISNSLKDYFINQGIKPNNVCVVNMFVDATRFERRDKTDDENILLTVDLFRVRKMVLTY